MDCFIEYRYKCFLKVSPLCRYVIGAILYGSPLVRYFNITCTEKVVTEITSKNCDGSDGLKLYGT